jgi:hypothetical protein
MKLPEGYVEYYLAQLRPPEEEKKIEENREKGLSCFDERMSFVGMLNLSAWFAEEGNPELLETLKKKYPEDYTKNIEAAIMKAKKRCAQHEAMRKAEEGSHKLPKGADNGTNI